MNGFFIPLLYGLAGVCCYAGLHHLLVASRRPVRRTHLLFALLCFAVAFHVIAKAGAYQADSAQALVALRRWEASWALVFFALLPWFVAEYTRIRPRALLAALSGIFVVVLAANLVLPHGAQFVDLPRLQYMTLPWGEQVVDLRAHQRTLWHDAAWVGIALVFAYSFYACTRQYSKGAFARACTLTLALVLFGVFVFVNWLTSHGVIQFIHTGEFGFLSLVIVMSLGLARELREGESRLQSVLDHVPAAVYLKDLQGRYLLINREFEQLYGMTNATVAGKADSDLFPAAQAAVLRTNDRRVVQSREPLELEETVDNNGEDRIRYSLKFPLFYPDGTPYAVCGVSTDITERRRAESELQQHRSTLAHVARVFILGELSASLAHELNQPLTAILSNAQAGLRFLDQDKLDLQEIREILQDIARDDKRASAVISGMRALARRQETERERIDLAEVLQQVRDLLHSELVVRGVQIEMDLEPGCAVSADRAQIQQVVLNLIMNAVEAMEGQPADQHHLQLSLSRVAEGKVQMAVRDSGKGIPVEGLAKVFDPFWTTKPQGMGLGLGICRSIIESHGGKIWVERNVAHGVTLYVKLPGLAQDESAKRQAQAASIRAV
jgi:two-component system sensor kinase FixL